MKRLDWNKNWQFFRQDCPEQVRTLDLPHDAMLEEPRCQENPSQSAGAYFAGGRYHYEKTFAWSPTGPARRSGCSWRVCIRPRKSRSTAGKPPG